MLMFTSYGRSIGKLVRLTATINDSPSTNRDRPFPFLLLDGLIANLAPWVHCGGHETVSEIPNFAPQATMSDYEALGIPRQPISYERGN